MNRYSVCLKKMINTIGMAGSILFLCSFQAIRVAEAQSILLSPAQIQWIGEAVFNNECAGQDECLLRWNRGENFLTLGIGNFIWYPVGEKGPREESFLKLLGYLKDQDQKIPRWLDTTPMPACPWKSREDFIREEKSPSAQELRRFLDETRSAQVAFLISRMEEALPAMLAAVPENEKLKITKQFFRLAADPEGIFVLVDYINFQGVGVFSTDQDAGKAWGLLSVLQAMKGEERGQAAVAEFVEQATQILTDRVDNAPPGRHEYQYLPGWLNRVKSYLIISSPVEVTPTAKPIISIAPDF